MERKGFRGGAAALVALSASVALAATAVAGAALLRFADELQDYDTAVAGPFDHATAKNGSDEASFMQPGSSPGIALTSVIAW